MLNLRTLLITGGTGSFGNAVLKKYLKTDIKEIRIFSRDEKKQDDMRHLYQDARIKYYIGDVRDIESVRSAIKGVESSMPQHSNRSLPASSILSKQSRPMCSALTMCSLLLLRRE